MEHLLLNNVSSRASCTGNGTVQSKCGTIANVLARVTRIVIPVCDEIKDTIALNWRRRILLSSTCLVYENINCVAYVPIAA